MATASEITQNIINQARLLDPNLSLEVGTPERKIVEAVAESIATASVDIEVLSGQLYIDELTGGRIDSFLSLFGFARQIGTRATGLVTVSRSETTTVDSLIRKGTQFSTAATTTIPSLIFVATETVSLPANATSAYVRVECTTVGTVGNLPAGSITSVVNSANSPGITSVINQTPTSGGVDTENDATLKLRFQNTVFRNMAGTTDQYLALALSHSAVSKANVIGAQSTYQEYIQVPASADNDPHPAAPGISPVYTTSLSSVPYSKYSYVNNYYVSKISGADSAFLKPNVNYIYNLPPLVAGSTTSLDLGDDYVRPNITLLGDNATLSLGSTAVDVILPGNIFLFEHKYISKASRNDWGLGIFNCVDVYVNSTQEQVASSEEQFPTVGMSFSSDSSQITYRYHYKRKATGDHPEIGNRLHVLFHQPAIAPLESSITINNVIYNEATYTADDGRSYTTFVYKKPRGFINPNGYIETEDTYWQDPAFLVQGVLGDYFLVEDISDNRGTVRARNGIEWVRSNPQVDAITPNEGASFNLDYTFNLSIMQLQSVMERAKQITTDVLVHSSNFEYMKLYITIMYTSGFTEETVNQQIVTALNAFFGSQYYGTTIQMSDLLQIIHNVSGVDNVRWTHDVPLDHPTDPQHKVEIVTKYGNSFSTRVFRDTDFILNDDQLPALADTRSYSAISNALVIQKRAQNTWSSNG
jgi:uncharacterized phage protein gp47/JayE